MITCSKRDRLHLRSKNVTREKNTKLRDREIGIREAIPQQHEQWLPISYLALKNRIYQQNIHKVELKSLYFNLVYVFLFNAKTRIYKQNTRTYTQNGAENSLFQFCLTITEPFSPFYLEEMKSCQSLSISRAVSQVIMRVRKPTVEYKLALQ